MDLSPLFGQDSYSLEYVHIDSLASEIEWKSNFKSYESLELHLTEGLKKLRGLGYYSASIDSLIHIDAFKHMAHIYYGHKFVLTDLDITQLDSTFKMRKLPQDLNQVDLLKESIIKHYEDQGFPFVQLKMADVKILDKEISGRLDINKGNKIYFDSIVLHGDLRLRNGFLNQYLDLHKGEILNRERLVPINKSLSELAFLKLDKPTEISFLANYASLHVYAKEKNASRFDFIFGVIPSDQIAGQNVFVSLDVTAEMLNKLGYGEYLYFEFERLRPEQQKLAIKANYPYLLDLPIAIDGRFDIFRNALDYLNLDSEIGVRYLLSNSNYLGVLWNFSSSRLIELDTASLLTTMSLPEDLDVKTNGLGLDMRFTNLDYKFNPRKGSDVKLRMVGGLKTILENFSITSLKTETVDFSDAYEDIELESYRLDLSTDIDFFVPIAQRATINLNVKAGWKYSGNRLNRNELFQMGGYQSLRGFDEASIFTSLYVVPGLEYRLLLSENSFFSLPFIDFAWIRDDLDIYNEGIYNELNFGYGVGGGLSFETAIGLFNFTIAAGKLSTDNLDLSKPKAHFGFVSIF